MASIHRIEREEYRTFEMSSIGVCFRPDMSVVEEVLCGVLLKCSSRIPVFLYPYHIYHAGQQSPAFANLRSHGMQPELVLLNTIGHRRKPS